MNDLLAFGRDILAKQSFSRQLGTALDVLTPGHAELSLPIDADLMQHQASVHGGVLAYLADNALAFAGGSLFGDIVTVELKINFTRPARGSKLRAVADVLHRSGAQAVCRCDVFCETDAGPVLCAAAQGTVRRPTERSDARP